MPRGVPGSKKAKKHCVLRKLAPGQESALNAADVAKMAQYYDKVQRDAVRDENSPNKCLIAATRRSSDGYAFIKVSLSERCGTPRAYALRGFKNGVHPRNNEDYSHLCHNGEGGCIDENHIIIEDKQKNLNRKDCKTIAKCPCCEKRFYVKECKCEPKCLQPKL